ncbi:MAG: DUF305 domain-containing protein [Candidatus Pacebacteria bacterium]|nr:DUF305 domain-containing protein [Candidatus Paceibacterota bacterium]
MKTNTLVAVIISLLIGGGIGYALNNSKPQAETPMMMDHSMMNMGDTGMEAMMMDMTARMEGKSGDELDRIFLEDMIVHHQGAVDMAIIIKESTERPELREFAQEIIDVQDQEINMMKGWLAEWFSNQ